MSICNLHSRNMLFFKIKQDIKFIDSKGLWTTESSKKKHFSKWIANHAYLLNEKLQGIQFSNKTIERQLNNHSIKVYFNPFLWRRFCTITLRMILQVTLLYYIYMRHKNHLSRLLDFLLHFGWMDWCQLWHTSNSPFIIFLS